MTDSIDALMIDVRAVTQGFEQDVATMRSCFDGTVLDGFDRAGKVLERGLLGAIQRGSLGFDDLRRIALSVVNDIAAQAMRVLMGALGGGEGAGGSVLNLGGMLSPILGLPGRATGGPVAPGRGYVVGERGPELFVPTSAGRVLPHGEGGAPRDVRVSIAIAAPPGTGAPQALQRSSRQVAAAVRRALAQN